MSVELIDKIKPKNNGTFPLVDAADVLMPNGSRLSTWQGGDQFEIPTIDLAEMGLPPIPEDGSMVHVNADISTITEALDKGIVRFKVDLQVGDGITHFETIMNAGSFDDGYVYWGACLVAEEEIYIQFWNGRIMAYVLTFKTVGEEEEAPTTEIPTFDLAALGLPAVPFDGSDSVVAEDVALEDVVDIMTALDAGSVKFKINVAALGSELPAEIVLNKISVEALGEYICTTVVNFIGTTSILTLSFAEVTIAAFFTVLPTGGQTPPTNIDLTAFDSAGQIKETYANGTVKTTTIEFDGNGNPVKITDGDGNVTTLTW